MSGTSGYDSPLSFVLSFFSFLHSFSFVLSPALGLVSEVLTWLLLQFFGFEKGTPLASDLAAYQQKKGIVRIILFSIFFFFN